MLGVSHEVLEEQTAVCEEVARQMVKGAINALNVDVAVAVTGIAGPGGGTKDIPVGTIWLAYGDANDIRTIKLEDDLGRDKNLAIATVTALQSLIDFLRETLPPKNEEEYL